MSHKGWDFLVGVYSSEFITLEVSIGEHVGVHFVLEALKFEPESNASGIVTVFHIEENRLLVFRVFETSDSSALERDTFRCIFGGFRVIKSTMHDKPRPVFLFIIDKEHESLILGHLRVVVPVVVVLVSGI